MDPPAIPRRARDRAAASPLAGLRVLVTRPVEQARSLLDAVARAGGVPIPYPTIAVGPPPSWAAFDAAASPFGPARSRSAASPGSYDWVVFTSPSAVRAALARSPELRDHLRGGAPRAAAVGPETARALERQGIPVECVPEDHGQSNQEGLIASLLAVTAGVGPNGSAAAGGAGLRILFPQALGGRALFSQELRARGATVDVVPVSQTLPLELAAPPPDFHLAIFASPSALLAFLAVWSTAGLAGRAIATIGPTTAAAVRGAGLEPHVVAPAPSVESILEAVIAGADRISAITGWRHPEAPHEHEH
jgi:uroporphyrinogen-III synthase